MPINALIPQISDTFISESLNGLFSSDAAPTSDAVGDQYRQALLFTSRLRTGVHGTGFGLFTADQAARLGLRGASDNTFDTQFVQDVTKQIGKFSKLTIELPLNPKMVTFEQPKRFTRQDTLGGADFHFWTDNYGQNNDILTMKFEGNTGNIYLGQKNRDPEAVTAALDRLAVLHDLYQLTREPAKLSDGAQNVITISYVSPLFPVPVQFHGFFPRVLDFTENAQKPRSRDWRMEFIVQATTPNLNELMTFIMDISTTVSSAVPADGSTNLVR